MSLSDSTLLLIYKKLNDWNLGKVRLVVCGCLLVVSGHLLLVCCHLWWFVVICWWFVFVCWWFVVITCFSNYGLKLCTLDGATLYLPVLRNYLRILKYFLSHITHCLVHLPASYFPVVTSALFFTQNYLVSFQDSLRFWKTFP